MANHKSTTKTSVNVSTYTRLNNIFQKKAWDRDLIADKIKQRYIKTLSLLDKEEQTLFLDLTERFIRIPQDEYIYALNDLLFYLCGKNKGKKLYFARCVSKSDLEKNKSSNELLYLFKGYTLKNLIDLDYRTVNDIKNINITELNDGTALLVLVDDFIGTGDTAMKALEYVYECHPGIINDSSIVFLSIASLLTGVEKIRDANYAIYTSNIQKRGITDYYMGERLSQVKGCMKKIEQKLQINPKFHFGYKRSEALICMICCPNNTFPIYWYSKGVAPYEGQR